jgi:phosphate starvation-inducible protein PhoH
VNFQNKDIVRHRLVDKIVKAYSKLEKQKWINQNQFL